VTAPRDDGVARLVPPRVGTYRITVDGKTEVRVAAPVAREIDLRPRGAAPSTAGAGVGEQRAKVDASGEVALLLLAVVAGEMALRAWSRRKLEAV
jgi:hypothetical protein